VVAAEHALRAANASIGAARAAFFPSITLTGAGGLQSSSLGALFAGAATGWSFAPQIMLPIFSVGRNQAELDLAKISKDIGIAQYEKTIQTAFREVSDGLAARGTFQEQLQAQKSLIAAYSEAYRLAEQRYRAGLDNYMPTLDAQRQLYLAQQAFISLQRGSLASAILLYKALGGGYA
jgi:multidrug efflux system outer membrane protein